MVSWYSRMPGAQVHPFMVGRCARAPSRPSIAARTAPWPSLRLPQRALCSSSSRAARRPAGMGRCMPRRHTQCEPCVVASSVLPTPATVAAEQPHGGFRMSKSASEIQTLMCTRSEPLPAAPSRLSRPISSAQDRCAQTARLCPHGLPYTPCLAWPVAAPQDDVKTEGDRA